MKGDSLTLILVCLLFVGSAYASRISGTYVAHAPTFAEMLQLTETDNGQLSGVLSHVELKQDGTVSSEQTPVKGTADSDQLTLKFPTILSFITGRSVSGTINGGAIHLQNVDSSGNVSSEEFVRSTPAQFKTYADEMKLKGERIVYDTKLLNLAREYRETVANAENWIANAEVHAERIPNAKSGYEQIEEEMKSLVSRERTTTDSVTRSQIAVAVMQEDITGEQVDIQVQQVWDIDIGEAGSKLEKDFADWDGNCGTDQELRKQGANDRAIEAWDRACKEVVAERAKFEPIYRRRSQQRAELKSFQVAAQAHRRALVSESNRIR